MRTQLLWKPLQIRVDVLVHKATESQAQVGDSRRLSTAVPREFDRSEAVLTPPGGVMVALTIGRLALVTPCNHNRYTSCPGLQRRAVSASSLRGSYTRERYRTAGV